MSVPLASGTPNAAAFAALPVPRAADARAMPGIGGLAFALWAAVALAMFEGPVRYGLNLASLDSLIFVRDALMLGALAIFVAARLASGTLAASMGVFLLLAVVHGAIGFLNFGTVVPAIYGLKMFVPALCGFLAAEAIFRPGPNVVRLACLMWLAAVAGASLDRFWLDYPWVGMSVDLGGVDVFLGRDWQSVTVERVGGLARSSINLAIGLPLLAFVLLASLRGGTVGTALVRVLVCALTLAVLVWTTQKGAILGFLLAVLALLSSRRGFTLPLKAAVVAATFLMVFAPTVLIHFDMPRDAGVFSFESLIERIERMWPAAWKWIDRHPALLGAGLGGIGGGQRFFMPGEFNPADNLFVYLYGSFVIASLAYLAAVVLVAVNARVDDFGRDAHALASLVFLLMYGLVISLIEDQVAALWLGASLGWLAPPRPAPAGVPATVAAVPDSAAGGRGG